MASDQYDFTLPTGVPPTTGLGGYGILHAQGVVDQVQDFVTDRISDAVRDAETMRQQAMDSIEQLTALDFQLDLPDPPPAPDLTSTIQLTDTEISPIELQDLGDIQFVPPAEPELTLVTPTVPEAVPLFSTRYSSFNLPSAPSIPATGNMPTEPTLTDVAMPTAPVLTFPSVPTLSDYNIPEFNEAMIEEFAENAPEFVDSPLAAVFNWSEPQYVTEILSEVEDKLRDMWNGRLGIPPEVENAMWLRATEREELTAQRNIASAFTEFSNRGFTMPPGTLAQRTDQMRDEYNRQAAGLNREITIEVAKIHVENVRFAVTQGVAVETLYYSIFANATNRLFEAEKARVEQQLAVYNAMVSVFNAKVSLYSTRITAYNARIAVVLDTYKARLQAEAIRADLNKLKVEVFTAQLNAVSVRVGVYEAQVRAAATQMDIGRNRIEIYRASIQAYAEKINAARVPFELYKTLVDAESAKTQFVNAEVAAYSAMIAGKTANSEIALKYSELEQNVNDTRIRLYGAQIEAEKASMQGQLGRIQAMADVYKADVSRFEAETRREVSQAELAVSTQQGQQRIEISRYEALIKVYETRMKLINERMGQVMEAIKAAGTITSTMASGAMAGINIGASLSGSGQTVGSGSSSYNESLSFQQGVSESISMSKSESKQ